MMKKKSPKIESVHELRKLDSFMDRRSGEDRRKIHSLEYFKNGGVDRRLESERRTSGERRADCIRVSEWSSVCPDKYDMDLIEGRLIL